MSGNEKRGVQDLFLQEKPVRILILLKKEDKPLYTAIISKEVDGTYAHTLNVLSKLEKLNLVSFRESGRIKLVKLTELGEEVAGALLGLEDLLGLGEIVAGIEEVYESEIKGRLREEMDKEAISKRLSKFKEKLGRYLEEKPQNVSIVARKLIKKADDTLAEALGYSPG